MGGSIEGVGWEIGGGTGLRGWMIGCELKMCWRIVCGVVSRSTLNVIAVVRSGKGGVEGECSGKGGVGW